jgi:hypothetical protein
MESDSTLEMKARRLHLPLRWIGSKDRMPKNALPGCYIINLQDDMDSNGNPQEGTHWTGLYIDEDGDAAYSDSFGFAPPAQTQLFLKKKVPYPYTTKQIQSEDTGWCGDYSLYFCYFMCSNKQYSNVKDKVKAYLRMYPNVKTNLQRMKSYMKYALQTEENKRKIH